MNNSGDRTHKARAIDPANFRAQATGIGQSTRASRETGGARIERVKAATPAEQRRATPAAEGQSTPDAAGLPMARSTPPAVIRGTTVSGRAVGC